ncbi:hypothetical protein K16_32575, partial [Klebsiella pneumoniae]
SALIAAGQSAQIGYHLNRAMDNGLSAEEAGEVVAQAAFYAGWPNAFTAAPVVGEVLRSRESKTEKRIKDREAVLYLSLIVNLKVPRG